MRDLWQADATPESGAGRLPGNGPERHRRGMLHLFESRRHPNQDRISPLRTVRMRHLTEVMRGLPTGTHPRGTTRMDRVTDETEQETTR